LIEYYNMIIQCNGKGQYTVTLPKPIVEALGWGKGRELAVEVAGKGAITLREK
jgi:bifunctional DNA-binding transcriptional regulator/antitoxin component of YhaV-PrlF toxin-antitoxin module